MKRRTVIFSPEARGDILRLYDWIAGVAASPIAISYIERLKIYCLGFELASKSGHRRDDVRPGLRIVGFEKRVTIAFVGIQLLHDMRAPMAGSFMGKVFRSATVSSCATDR